MIELRWHQEGGAVALFEAVKRQDCHPVAAMPTASGKSYTICEFCNLWLTYKPTSNILVLSHVAEILEQNAASLEKYFGGYEVGLYSAGLGSRTIKKITVAGIQSIHRKTSEFKDFDIVIIDEAHRVPVKEETMYQRFLNSLDATFVGLTATPFRLGSGYIYKGEGAIFNELCYDVTSMENYNKLVSDGYLSEMYTKSTALKLDAEGNKIKITAGDYNDKALSKAFDRDDITEVAINEAVDIFKKAKRKHMLVFAIDIKHAENIASKLNKHGLKVICIHSKMSHDRKKAIIDIKSDVYDAVVNVDVLTTGFDYPKIDHIVDLKPTKSPVQHVQKLGRGARIHPEKDYCLISDFAGNVATLGPINNVQVSEKKKKGDGTGDPIQKICNECGCYNFPSVKFCANCGGEFTFVEKIMTQAHEGSVIQKETKQWLRITGIAYSIANNPGKPSSLRVVYNVGLVSFTERIYLQHPGMAGHMARNWAKFRLGSQTIPKTVDDLYSRRHELLIPSEILVDNTGKYNKVINYKFI